MSSTAGTPPPPFRNSLRCPEEVLVPTPLKLRVPRSSMIHTKFHIVDVQCGADGPIFKVHLTTLLISPYFYNRLSVEGTRDVIHVYLDEKDPFVLEAYIHFLYTGTLPTSPDEQDKTPATVREEIELLSLLHRFADKIKHAEFYNATLDGIIDISRIKDEETGLHCLPDPAKISYLPSHSKTMCCFIDLYAHFMDPEDPVLDRPENQQFMREVLKASMRRFIGPNAHFMDPENAVFDRPECQQFMREALKAFRRMAQVNSEHGGLHRHELKNSDYYEEGVGSDDGDEEWLARKSFADMS